MSDKIVLPIHEIEGLDEKGLCIYAKQLGIDLSPYAEQLEPGRFFLRRREELLRKVLDRRSAILLEEQMRSNRDVAERASKAAVISAIFAGMIVIAAIITIVVNLLD
jgi:hypothetical protein